MQTLGSLIDTLCTVDLKMWNAQEQFYKIRHMTFGEFQTYMQSLENMEEIYYIFKKGCDLNYQRSELISEIDQMIIKMIQAGIDGQCLDKYIRLAHKTY